MLTISKDLPLGVYIHPALKRKSQIIQFSVHVHMASSPAFPTTIFRTRQKEPGDEAKAMPI